ncbi:helix-turn-helix domain-containing protein [Streptomyces sp. NPDC005708]|uniref:PucR family transcriptional regulator n=1 Tax=Streptomyces sp. NPDC005708 TaxID=3154564 RepID=UPI0033F85536
MTNPPSAPLRDVLSRIGVGIDSRELPADALEFAVSGARIWWPGGPLPGECSEIVLCPPGLAVEDMWALHALPADSDRRVVIVASADPCETAGAQSKAGHVVVPLPAEGYDVESLLVEIRHVVERPDQASARRLASLQRSLSTSLGHAHPIPDLLSRLRKQFSATFALIDAQGRAIHTTGPLPQALIFDQIRVTEAESQRVSIDGWSGIAARLEDVDSPGSLGGWLIAVTRRGEFTYPSITAAVHVAGSLVETSLRVAAVTRDQERAVRAALLEEAIALRPVRGDQELAGRIAGLGISFGNELRVAALQPRPSRAGTNRDQNIAELETAIQPTLAQARVSALTSAHNGVLVVLMQCSPRDLRRMLISSPEKFTGVSVGVGRAVTDVGDIADSYNDAQLALRMLRRRRAGAFMISYEEFDTASRLFADVGLENMQAWAQRYLAEIVDRSGLFEALSSYFQHDQNINAAAHELGIHHNSLRYRLGKVEEALDISLRSPSAVASVFLALTALDLSNERTRIRPGRQSPRDSDAIGSATDFGAERVTGLTRGVVRGSDS